MFEFKLRVIGNAKLTINVLGPFPFEIRAENATLLRKQLIRGANNFGHYDGPARERDDMPVACDVYLCRILTALDASCSVDTK